MTQETVLVGRTLGQVFFKSGNKDGDEEVKISPVLKNGTLLVRQVT